MRSVVSEECGTLRIVIPMRRKVFLLLFLCAWLGGWTLGGIAIGKQLSQKFNLFEAFWMCGWVMGEVMATYALTRMLGGRDILQLGDGVFELRKEAFGIGLSKRYSLSEIRDLRFRPETGGGKSHQDSCIAFDNGAKTITLGDGIDEGEANQLIRTILDRYRLIPRSSTEPSSTRFWQSN
jgi:hypothetical protein